MHRNAATDFQTEASVAFDGCYPQVISDLRLNIMTSDFFDSLERQIAKQGLTERARRENLQALVSDNLNFVSEVLPQIHKLIADYDGKLQLLGYSSHMRSGPNHVQITLEWADSGRMEIEYKRNIDTNGLSVLFFQAENKQLLVEPDARLLNRSNWDPIEEVEFLQRSIQQFTDQAEEHGGL